MDSLHEKLDPVPNKEDVAAWKTCHFLDDVRTQKKYPELSQGWLARTLKELTPACPDEKDLFADRGETIGAVSNEALYYAICAAQETLGASIDGIFGPETYLALKLWSDRNRVKTQARYQESLLQEEIYDLEDKESSEAFSLNSVSCFGASLEVGMMSSLGRLMKGSPNNRAEVGAGSTKILSKIQAASPDDIQGDTVIYSGGVGNDIVSKVSPQKTIGNMLGSLSALLQKGAKRIVLPLRVPYVSQKVEEQKALRQLNTMIRDSFGHNPRIQILEAPSALMSDNGDLLKQYGAGDGIHLNSAGYGIYAEHIKKALLPQETNDNIVA